MNSNEYMQFFNNFIITDCIVRQKHLIYFVLEEDLEQRIEENDEKLPTVRIVIYYPLHEEGDKWGSKTFDGTKRMKAGVSFTPEERFVGVDFWGQVF
ncbi:MAG: hypothetical protein GY694_07945, partial [Gammaproteobacteria bacterium]|nr:hypothetical protein [Gammaproteobacteria bacterium]